MKRRDFLYTLPLLALAGCARPRIPVAVHLPGMASGHMLRDAQRWPEPTETIRCATVILGSGAAGLFAAWRLSSEGYHDFRLVEGPEPQGNARSVQLAGLSAPSGAHYLPLPSPESRHVREMLAALGVLEGAPQAARPHFDEMAVVHAPEDRLLINGHWQEGMVPDRGVPPQERAQIARFLAYTQSLRHTRGADGRRAFAIPLALSSQDPQLLALDRESFAQWLDRNGYTAPSLRWYLDYCCRDDYGTALEGVSAWAGLYYFACRGGHAANADDGAVLTWPGGLGALTQRLLDSVPAANRQPGMAVRVRLQGRGVEVLCLSLDGQRCSRIEAQRAILAMPLHVAAHVVEGMAALGYDPGRDQPQSASWLVSNFLLDTYPQEREATPVPPYAWDNVVYQGQGLGWVIATHQLIRQARPSPTLFTAYHALSAQQGRAARAWLQSAGEEPLLALASSDLVAAYGQAFWQRVQRVDITVRGHAMAQPAPGFLSRPGIAAVRALDGPLLFAHADLSGLSVFEEASWWGDVAARKILSA